MTNVIRAEILKLTTRRALLIESVFVLAFGIGAAITVFLSATEAGDPTRGRLPSVASLSTAGGATEAFTLGAGFAGILAFVLLTANITGEFSQGTFRTMLMQQPDRLRLLGGKVAGLIVFIAGLLFVAASLSVVASLVMAPSQDVSTGEWFTITGLREAVTDYGTVVLMAAVWTVYATTLGITLRSIPLALGVGIAWTGPFEHLMMDAIPAVEKWFPGLLLESLAAGGTDDVSVGWALSVTAVYVTIAAAIAGLLFTRRDVTG